MKQKVCFNALQSLNFSSVSEKYCTKVIFWVEWVGFYLEEQKRKKQNKQKILPQTPPNPNQEEEST